MAHSSYAPPIPVIQVRNSCLIQYYQSQSAHHTRNDLQQYKTYSSRTTKTTSKNITRVLDLLLQISPERNIWNPVTNKFQKHRLTFITLTIPGKEQHIEARQGHKLLLEPWLRSMRRQQNLVNYIWKAEFQKNGQLHYHITTPEFIPYYAIRDQWNFRMSTAGMLKAWLQVHGDKMPNSTDVHSVHKMKNIQAYLTKYLRKGSQDKTTDGKIWDCSKRLKKAKFFSFVESTEMSNKLSTLPKKENDFCSIIPLTQPTIMLSPTIREKYYQYLRELKGISGTLIQDADPIKTAADQQDDYFQMLVSQERMKKNQKVAQPPASPAASPAPATMF